MPENLPREENYEAALEEAVDEALEGDLRAEEWRRLKNALLHRRALIENEWRIATDKAERQKLKAALTETDEQIAVLQEEENVTKFIEDSVRFSSEVRRLQQG